MREILDYLGTAQDLALMAKDRETADRLERAITVMETPAKVDVFSGAFEDYLTKHGK
ncbi:MAG: hypothetical protein IKF98_00205 [Clostridia bacterium]|nr:hypothetical protein [Clostridia bacterium]